MGIVVFCPNGHRINVKDSFAGRKGLCPTCGEKFRVPAAGSGITAPGSALPTARLLDLDAAVAVTLPRVLPFDGAAPGPVTAAAPDIDRFAVPEPTPAAAPTFAPAPAPITAQPTFHPALAERPDLLWCIAFPGGEPTEPLPAESMQAWLDAGQAEGTEVVWRSDWPEWRPARDVFPDVLM
jgi:hypothetical protein